MTAFVSSCIAWVNSNFVVEIFYDCFYLCDVKCRPRFASTLPTAACWFSLEKTCTCFFLLSPSSRSPISKKKGLLLRFQPLWCQFLLASFSLLKRAQSRAHVIFVIQTYLNGPEPCSSHFCCSNVPRFVLTSFSLPKRAQMGQSRAPVIFVAQTCPEPCSSHFRYPNVTKMARAMLHVIFVDGHLLCLRLGDFSRRRGKCLGPLEFNSAVLTFSAALTSFSLLKHD